MWPETLSGICLFNQQRDMGYGIFRELWHPVLDAAARSTGGTMKKLDIITSCLHCSHFVFKRGLCGKMQRPIDTNEFTFPEWCPLESVRATGGIMSNEISPPDWIALTNLANRLDWLGFSWQHTDYITLRDTLNRLMSVYKTATHEPPPCTCGSRKMPLIVAPLKYMKCPECGGVRKEVMPDGLPAGRLVDDGLLLNNE